MKIITKKKAIKYLENEIESLDCECFEDNYEAFAYIHRKMIVFDDLGILNKDELTILWNKLINKTEV